MQSTELTARHASGVIHDFHFAAFQTHSKCPFPFLVFQGDPSIQGEGAGEHRGSEGLPHYVSIRHQQSEAWPCFLLLLVGSGPAPTPTQAETQVGTGMGRKLTQRHQH